MQLIPAKWIVSLVTKSKPKVLGYRQNQQTSRILWIRTVIFIENLFVFFVNTFSVLEWMVFKNEIIKEVVAQNSSDIKSLRKSLLYDIKGIKDNMAFHFSQQNKTKSFAELKCNLDLEEPFKDLESFYKFDSKIRTDKDHADALVLIFFYKLDLF